MVLHEWRAPTGAGWDPQWRAQALAAAAALHPRLGAASPLALLGQPLLADLFRSLVSPRPPAALVCGTVGNDRVAAVVVRSPATTAGGSEASEVVALEVPASLTEATARSLCLTPTCAVFSSHRESAAVHGWSVAYLAVLSYDLDPAGGRASVRSAFSMRDEPDPIVCASELCAVVARYEVVVAVGLRGDAEGASASAPLGAPAGVVLRRGVALGPARFAFYATEAAHGTGSCHALLVDVAADGRRLRMACAWVRTAPESRAERSLWTSPVPVGQCLVRVSLPPSVGSTASTAPTASAASAPSAATARLAWLWMPFEEPGRVGQWAVGSRELPGGMRVAPLSGSRFLLYHDRSPGRPQLWEVPAGGGEPQLVRELAEDDAWRNPWRGSSFSAAAAGEAVLCMHPDSEVLRAVDGRTGSTVALLCTGVRATTRMSVLAEQLPAPLPDPRP
eukprot:m51a1_g7668 hypothetical protein (449) ;mRNA; f:461030-462493